jgi:hypothetical protein
MSSEIAEAVAAMIAERERARIADHRKRKTSQADFAADAKKRRSFGLKRRYALKAARLRAAERLT